MITNYTKQANLIDVKEFNKRINIIGCGALGSWLVFFLLKMGFENIHVYDYDDIEEHNIPNQMFKECDIGNKKVEAIYTMYKEYFNDTEDRLFIHDMKITKENVAMFNNGYLLCAVDNMRMRKVLYESTFKYGTCIFIEGRLSIYGAYIYTLVNKDTETFEAYENTLYSDEDAEISSCGVSQTALPSAVNCASIMIMCMIENFKGNELDMELRYSIPWLVKM